MRALAIDLAPHRIRVNTVHPTGVNTTMIINDVMAMFLEQRPRRRPERVWPTRSRCRWSRRSTSATRAVARLGRGPLRHRCHAPGRRRLHDQVRDRGGSRLRSTTCSIACERTGAIVDGLAEIWTRVARTRRPRARTRPRAGGGRRRPRHRAGGPAGHRARPRCCGRSPASGASRCVFVEGNADLTPAKLVGHHNPARVLREDYSADNFVDGPLVEAMRGGGFLYIEEFNRAPEDTLNTLLTAMAERQIAVPRVGDASRPADLPGHRVDEPVRQRRHHPAVHQRARPALPPRGRLPGRGGRARHRRAARPATVARVDRTGRPRDRASR